MKPNPTMQVFDKNLRRTGTLIDSYDIQRKRRINSDYEITFMVPMTSEDYREKINLKGHVQDERGQFYVIQSRSRSREGEKLTANIYCNHIMFKLMDFKFPYASYIEEAFGVHISQLTDAISAATGGRFTFQIHDTFPLHDVKDWGRGDCLQALNGIIKMYECEIEPDNFVIHIKKKIGSENGLQYRLKKNIVSSSFKDIGEKIVTRLFGQMEQGRTIIGLDASKLTNEERNLLSQVPGAIVNGKIAVSYLISPYAPYWSSDSTPFLDGELTNYEIMEPEDLLEAMRTKLREQEQPELEVTVSSADLHKIDKQEPKPGLGDTVMCIDPKMEMNKLKARITELIEYPYSRDKHSQPTISNVMPYDDLDIIADLQKSKDLVDSMFSNGKIRTEVFEAAAKQAIIDINNSKTELIYPPEGGILAQEKSNPLKQVRLTSAGLGISTDGWKTIRSAVTADGVIAERIIGQQIVGVSLIIGVGNNITQINPNGISAGHVNFNSAPARIDMQGNAVFNKLTANSAQINGSNLNSSTWKDGYFTGNITAQGEIIGGIITGALIRTAANGQRIEINYAGLRAIDSAGRTRMSISQSGKYGIAGTEYSDEFGRYIGTIAGLEDGFYIDSDKRINLYAPYIDVNGGRTEFYTIVDFSSASVIGLKLSSISNLTERLNELQSQISSLVSTFNSHRHTVTTAHHNHGNPDNAPNTGGGTYTTSTP